MTTSSTTVSTPQSPSSHQAEPSPPRCSKITASLMSFWVMGLLNNASFIIMLAGAKSISEGGTALVFIADTLPSFLISLSAPYWFHRVGYSARLYCTAALFSASFFTVAFFAADQERDEEGWTPNEKAGFELIGVALGSLGMGMGEASLLALAGKYDKNHGDNIAAFCSGTGLAGVFGFAWRAMWNEWMGMSFTQTLLLANVLAGFYAYEYYVLLSEERKLRMVSLVEQKGGGGIEMTSERGGAMAKGSNENCGAGLNSDNQLHRPHKLFHDDEVKILVKESDKDIHEKNMGSKTKQQPPPKENLQNGDTESTCSLYDVEFEEMFSDSDMDDSDDDNDTYDDAMTPHRRRRIDEAPLCDRVRFVLSLWPYTIPLFVVYFCEYALQSGTWTAIGFPVYSAEDRDRFYVYSNWMYQIGVFLSRSSGAFCNVSLGTIWAIPFLQFINLIFFSFIAIDHTWYDWSLLSLCFLTGLLGGTVYVNAYAHINAAVSKHDKEFALASASSADNFGIFVANVFGLFLQSCLYQANSIGGAVVTCPFNIRRH